MSFDVELLVTFRCSHYSRVAPLARHHLACLRETAEQRKCPEAITFLEDLAARQGTADQGPKNGVAAWTYGGNYTRPDDFAEVLRPFWDDLLRYPVDGGPLRPDHVLVLYQLQERGQIDALQIYLDLPERFWEEMEHLSAWPLVVDRHEGLPLSW
jgi:hypothetical protein